MPSIVLVSPQAGAWRDFVHALKKDTGVEIKTARSGAEAVRCAREGNLLAMVIDADIHDMDGLALVRRVMSIDAMINVAWVSDLPAEEFHAQTEGLGILMQLSPGAGTAEAFRLAERLRQVTGAI